MTRKDFLRTSAAGVVTAALAGVARAADGDLVGRVTAGGRALAGVIVTDGLVCVLTDKDGSFRLPPREGVRFVTVTVPSGYLLRDYYRKIDPLAGRYDFALEKFAASAGRGCRFAQIADSEIRDAGPGNQKWIGEVREIAAENKCAFIVHTGDICNDRGMTAHAKLMTVDTMGIPVVYCVGNHDCIKGDYGEQFFERTFGPSWFSFDAGGIHFLNVPMIDCWDVRPGYTEDSLAEWLRADLALVGRKRPVMVFSHMLFHPRKEDEAGLVIGRKNPLNLKDVCNFKGFVYGHTHNTLTRVHGGVTCMCSTNANFGGIDHSPELLRVFTVKPDGSFVSDNHYGRRPMRSWKTERADALWEKTLPSPVLFCTPVVSRGTVFVGTTDDENRGTGTVVALDAKSGAIVWKRKVGSIKNRIAVAGGNVIAQDATGTVSAFATSGGKTAWTLKLPYDFSALMSAVTASADGRTAYVGIGPRLTAVDAATGEVKWRASDWKCEPVVQAPAIGEGRMVWAANWDGLECHDLATGKHLWSAKGMPWRFPGVDPLIIDGKVVVACNQNLGEVDLATGKTLREKNLRMTVSIPAGPILVSGKNYLFGTFNDGLVAVDRETWETVWRAPVDRSLVGLGAYKGPAKMVNTSPVVAGDGIVAAACADGTIRFWNAENGRETRKISTGAPYLAGVAVSGGRLFAADLTGRIRAFSVTGQGT